MYTDDGVITQTIQDREKKGGKKKKNEGAKERERLSARADERSEAYGKFPGAI